MNSRLKVRQLDRNPLLINSVNFIHSRLSISANYIYFPDSISGEVAFQSRGIFNRVGFCWQRWRALSTNFLHSSHIPPHPHQQNISNIGRQIRVRNVSRGWRELWLARRFWITSRRDGNILDSTHIEAYRSYTKHSSNTPNTSLNQYINKFCCLSKISNTSISSILPTTSSYSTTSTVGQTTRETTLIYLIVSMI